MVEPYMMDMSYVSPDARASAAIDDLLKKVWKSGTPLSDVRIPYTRALHELALLSQATGNGLGLRVSRAWISGRIRLRGTHEEIMGVLDMYLAVTSRIEEDVDE